MMLWSSAAPLLASLFACIFNTRSTWKYLMFWKYLLRWRIFWKIWQSFICGGLFLVMRALIRSLESPKTKILPIPLARAIFKPCHNPQNSAALLDSIPSPQAYLLSVFPLAKLITPPAPAEPGFPFEAPSKKRKGSFKDDFQRLKSASSNIISHCSDWGMRRVIRGWRLGVNELNQHNSSCRSWVEFFKDRLLSRASPRIALACAAIFRGGESWFLKILLFLLSQSFQQIAFGSHS